MYVYDEIGASWDGSGITATSVAQALKDIGTVDTLDVYVNSPGGEVFEGIAIYNQLKRNAAKKIVHIDGIAASIASVIAMAGDEILMAENATMMIHQAWGLAIGTADDMRSTAGSLDKIDEVILNTYVSRTGGDAKKIAAMVKAETWMNATEALELGFATKTTDAKNMRAEFPLLAKFKRTPPELRRQAKQPDLLRARMDMRTSHLKRRPAGATA